MTSRLLLIILAMVLVLSGCGKHEGTRVPGGAQAKDATGYPPGWRPGMPIPVDVPPIYDSNGPQINVGPFSVELARATPGGITKSCV